MSMTHEDLRERFDEWRREHGRPAWKPVIGDGTSRSWFGGAPLIETDIEWPACSSCKAPMRFFLQIDLADTPNASEHPVLGLLQMFYCSTDDGMCETWQPFSGAHHVRIVDPSGEEATGVGPAPFPKKIVVSWEELVDLPSAEEHEDLGLSYDYDFDRNVVSISCPAYDIDLKDVDLIDDAAETIASPEAGDKLGGWPMWIQGVEYPQCPYCDETMSLVLQVDSECNLPIMFGDVGCGHVTQCRQHPHQLAFGWACS